VTTVYNHIPDNAQAENTSAEEKLKLISQTIEHYRQDIEELKENMTPTTPPEVREKRKQEASLQLAELEKHVSTTEELFDRVVQLWTVLDEDEQVQQWDQEEERLNASIQELKNRQKTMSITECLKGNQDLKKLQADLKAAQMKKQERQAEVEPLQEKASADDHTVGGGEEEHGASIEECATMIQEEITVQSVEALTGKSMQVKTRGRELAEKFQILETTVEGACTS
jgi:hypothetical protein